MAVESYTIEVMGRELEVFPDSDDDRCWFKCVNPRKCQAFVPPGASEEWVHSEALIVITQFDYGGLKIPEDAPILPPEYDEKVDGMVVHVIAERVKNFMMRIGKGGQPEMHVPVRASREEVAGVIRKNLSFYRTNMPRDDEKARYKAKRWVYADVLGEYDASNPPGSVTYGHPELLRPPESKPKDYDYAIEVDDVVVYVSLRQVKGFGVSIGRDGRVLMSAPEKASRQEATDAVRRNMAWIRSRLTGEDHGEGDNMLAGEKEEPAVERPKWDFDYTVERDGVVVYVTLKRVKNFNMRIVDGYAVMSAPLDASRRKVQEVVSERLDWYKNALERYNEKKVEHPTAWKTGERLYVWGEPVTLEVIDDEEGCTCELEEDRLIIRAPERFGAWGRAALVNRWLGELLRSYVDQILPDCAARVGAMPTSIQYRAMRSRWGSCTKKSGAIRLSTTLVHCPKKCVEMVLCHELCHLIEANHGQRFYALLDLACPDWRVSDAWLKSHHPTT